MSQIQFPNVHAAILNQNPPPNVTTQFPNVHVAILNQNPPPNVTTHFPNAHLVILTHSARSTTRPISNLLPHQSSHIFLIFPV